jgi:hypothetical protein
MSCFRLARLLASSGVVEAKGREEATSGSLAERPEAERLAAKGNVTRPFGQIAPHSSCINAAFGTPSARWRRDSPPNTQRKPLILRVLLGGTALYSQLLSHFSPRR